MTPHDGQGLLPRETVEPIEQRYWQPIQAGSTIEEFVSDPALALSPHSHPALFSDHGISHVRDIAEMVDELATRNDGVLIPKRNPQRLQFLRTVAAAMTYLHDIGMVAPTAAARKVHPQFAAQTALGEGFADVLLQIWKASNLLSDRVEALQQLNPAAAQVSSLQIFREVLAMSLCHSKSAVPPSVLNDRVLLRRFMQRGAFTPLRLQLKPLVELVSEHWNVEELAETATGYQDVRAQSFAWLCIPSAAAQDFCDDVIDAVRILRAGDALRKRGVLLRTSGGYEICIHPTTGDAVYGLRTRDGLTAALLAVKNPISAAESNIAFAVISSEGVLRIGLHRAFNEPHVRQEVIEATSDLVADIEADAVQSFIGEPRPVELFVTAEDPAFTHAIATTTQQRHVRLAGRIVVVHPEQVVAEVPMPEWYSQSLPFMVSEQSFDDLLNHMEAGGLATDRIDRKAAGRGLRLAHIRGPTDILLAGSRALVVVVPLGKGLHLFRDGEPQSSNGEPLPPFLPVGVTGVVRGGVRNATVVAVHSIDLLVIPGDVYLREWFRPFPVQEIAAVVGRPR